MARPPKIRKPPWGRPIYKIRSEKGVGGLDSIKKASIKAPSIVKEIFDIANTSKRQIKHLSLNGEKVLCVVVPAKRTKYVLVLTKREARFYAPRPVKRRRESRSKSSKPGPPKKGLPKTPRRRG